VEFRTIHDSRWHPDNARRVFEYTSYLEQAGRLGDKSIEEHLSAITRLLHDLGNTDLRHISVSMIAHFKEKLSGTASKRVSGKLSQA
jgi:hypothetical protein